MSEISVQDELLQQYFDGELPAGQTAEIEAQLASDPAYASRYESLLRLREMITLSAEEISAEVDFNALFGRIEDDLQEKQTGQRAPSMLEQLSTWWKELSTHKPVLAFGAPALAVIAVALWAGLGAGPAQQDAALATHAQPTKPVPEQEVQAQQPEDVQARWSQQKPAPVALAQNSEVVQVDFGDNTGTVFEIALAEGVSTPVVWINDEE